MNKTVLGFLVVGLIGAAAFFLSPKNAKTQANSSKSPLSAPVSPASTQIQTSTGTAGSSGTFQQQSVIRPHDDDGNHVFHDRDDN